MEAFVWSDRYATGIASVDAQHHELVNLTNQVGDLVGAAATTEPGVLPELFKRLADYARFHFGDEERLMQEAGIDPGYLATHQQLHREFTEQMLALWHARERMATPVATLYGFLSSWLSYHILGEDQVMARQIGRIRQGASASDALALESNGKERATGALLAAMQTLYSVISQQNRDLEASNRALEARVAERTEEIALAYADLEARHQELATLLERMNKTQSQLLQSEKMASIGQLAAGVAHEINNPVGFVNSNLGSLARYVEDLLRLIEAGADCPAVQALAQEVDLPFLRDDVRCLLIESREGLERVRKIVANLKDFSHVDEAQWQEADLIAGLESTLNVVWHEIKYKAEVVRELQPLPPVCCIPAQINQVLVNLLVNSAQAIVEHGTITVRSGVAGDEVWMEIEDTGCGMSEEVKNRIFEPFFTTKPVGQGTGLGMSVNWDIIHAHAGRFDVDSTPGKGTRIRFWLPIGGPATAGD